MSYTEKDTQLGNHVRFTPNTLASRKGIPTAIAEISMTQTAPAVADPKTLKRTGTDSKGLAGLKKHSVKTKI